VAVSNENFVVPDVAAQDNYIACSFTVKSEIVVPLFVDKNIGQIDIDSHVLDPFTAEDERFLEFVCAEISNCIKLIDKISTSILL
jgi:GAF domain-containing protein